MVADSHTVLLGSPLGMHAPTRRVLRGDVPYAFCRTQPWRVFWAVRNRVGVYSCDVQVHSMLSGDAVLYDVDVATAHYAHARLSPSHGGRLAQPGGAHAIRNQASTDPEKNPQLCPTHPCGH